VALSQRIEVRRTVKESEALKGAVLKIIMIRKRR
jgi:hypothetical protein